LVERKKLWIMGLEAERSGLSDAAQVRYTTRLRRGSLQTADFLVLAQDWCSPA